MTDKPNDSLPALGIAAIIGAVVLVLFILPAEYGVDPTGFGEGIGIKDDGSALGTAGVHGIADAPYRNDTVNILVGPGQGLEYKFVMDQGNGFVYTWNATGDLYFDFHGEPDSNSFRSYQTGTDSRADGSFQAPFAGTHGWYWKNDGDAPVTVTLTTSGHYEIKGLV